jgi:hypothetical protein
MEQDTIMNKRQEDILDTIIFNVFSFEGLFVLMVIGAIIWWFVFLYLPEQDRIVEKLIQCANFTGMTKEYCER